MQESWAVSRVFYPNTTSYPVCCPLSSLRNTHSGYLSCRCLLQNHVKSIRIVCMYPHITVLLLLLDDDSRLVVKGLPQDYLERGFRQVSQLMAGQLNLDLRSTSERLAYCSSFEW